MTSLLYLGLIFLVVCSFITSYQTTQKSNYLKQKNAQLFVSVEKYLAGRMNAVASIWPKIMLAHLSSEIICSSLLTVFIEFRPGKTIRISEQIMSADKRKTYHGNKSSQLIFSCRERITEYIFTPNGGYCLFNLGLYLPLVWVESNSCRRVKIWNDFTPVSSLKVRYPYRIIC